MALYQWIATESAPEDAPAHVVKGDLLFPGGSTYVPDHRVAKNGWGMRGASHLVGDPLRPVPTELRLTWFSYPEDRFYRGTFPLPTARMAALFAEGVVVPRTGKRTTYDTVIVGMAPGGAVAVWMAAGALTVEVATFRATAADLDWKLVLDNPAITREQQVRKVMASVAGATAAPRASVDTGGLDTWMRRHTKYPWAPEVSGDAQASSLSVRSWNGEYEPFLVPGAAPARSIRAAPREVRLDWTDAAGQRHGAQVLVDEAEAMAALATLSGPGRDVPVTLELRIESGGSGLRVSFKNGRAAVRLRDAVVKVFRRKG